MILKIISFSLETVDKHLIYTETSSLLIDISLISSQNVLLALEIFKNQEVHQEKTSKWQGT